MFTINLYALPKARSSAKSWDFWCQQVFAPAYCISSIHHLRQVKVTTGGNGEQHRKHPPHSGGNWEPLKFKGVENISSSSVCHETCSLERRRESVLVSGPHLGPKRWLRITSACCQEKYPEAHWCNLRSVPKSADLTAHLTDCWFYLFIYFLML